MNFLSFMKFRHLATVVLFMVYSSFAAVYAEEQSPQVVQGEYFKVAYESMEKPVPLNRIHSWKLKITTLEGTVVENAKVTAYGGMPAHRHGLPTQPVVSELGEGEYLVEGMKFSMTGLWEIWFDVQKGKASDKLKFVLRF